MPTNREYELDEELRELENQLSNLTPVAMPAALAERVNQSMKDLDDEGFDDLEQQLAELGTVTMSEDVIARMANAMDRWHEELPVEEKLVPFDVGDSLDSVKKEGAEKSVRKGMWASAAAVAMLGALSALAFPGFDSNASSQANSSTGGLRGAGFAEMKVVLTESRDAWLVPDSLTHKVTNTTESGIVMAEGNAPHRCIQVEYVNTVKVLDSQGRAIEIERPGVEVMLLPIVTD